MVLVVGATGDIGFKTVVELQKMGKDVRAMVRTHSKKSLFDNMDKVEVVFGDLTDKRSLEEATKGVDEIVVTANVIYGGAIEAIEGQGFMDLIDACKLNRVKHFVFLSNGENPKYDSSVPTMRYKRLNEQRLATSGLNYTVVQGTVFLEDHLAFAGSMIPFIDNHNFSARRPFWFTRFMFKFIYGMVEKNGIAAVPGDGKLRQAWVVSEDLARMLAKCVGVEEVYNTKFAFGGPENLSYNALFDIYSKVASKEIKTIHPMPNFFLRFMQKLFGIFNKSSSNAFGLNFILGVTSYTFDKADLPEVLQDIELTSVEDYLTQQYEKYKALNENELKEIFVP